MEPGGARSANDLSQCENLDRRLLKRALLRSYGKQKAHLDMTEAGSCLKINPGSDLLSHTPTHAVPSAVAGLTSVFGMGTGGTLPL